MYVGTVTRVDVDGAFPVVYVEVPQLAAGFEVGPCEIVQAAAGAAAAVGARVVLGALDIDGYVVLGVLPG